MLTSCIALGALLANGIESDRDAPVALIIGYVLTAFGKYAMTNLVEFVGAWFAVLSNVVVGALVKGKRKRPVAAIEPARELT